MADAAKELGINRREGFGQHEGKRTRYSGDFLVVLHLGVGVM